MKSSKLFVSFWDICLDNLPEGTFAHRRIKLAEARLAISRARRNKSLLCVSKEDLLAPYRKRERQNHADVCKALKNSFGIKLELTDFCGSLEDEDGSLNIVNPLSLVQVQRRDRLLIVTCAYVFSKRKRKDRLAMDVEPSSVEFHLIGVV